MFNAPRPNPVRYSSPQSSGLAASFLSDNPLASSIYNDDGGLDPWSAAPSPPPMPEIGGAFSRVIADATIPSIYNDALAAVDPNFTGETSLNSLSRVLGASGLPAATIDRIINLVSSKPRVSKLEFFVALALVALAQQEKDMSIEQVASIVQQSQTLPIPTLDLSQVTVSQITVVPPAPVRTYTNGYGTTSGNYPNPAPNSNIPTSPAPAYSDTDPWNTAYRRPMSPPGSTLTVGQRSAGASIMGGLPSNWWNKQERISIAIFPEKQGFILNRYTVYVITPERGLPVHRRYSEFVFLWDCFIKRYPFRIIPNLPPKRLGADASFLEQRRKGLVRWLNYVINHPIISADGMLAAFLTEPSFENWRKHSSVSLDEESISKRVDRVEEMSIPADLEEKMNIIRGKLPDLIESWTRICAIAERLLRRREAEAADLYRLHLTINALNEHNATCWHKPDPDDGCDLHGGVRAGLTSVSARLRNQSDLIDQRTQVTTSTSLEQLKAQRDLYIAVRDLFARHLRLSGDKVDTLRRRVELNGQKLQATKVAQKDGWQQEAEKLTSSIERDQLDITTALARRVFIRHCMWHELRVILHNRENALVTQAVQTFSQQERDFVTVVVNNWDALMLEVENMPYE